MKKQTPIHQWTHDGTEVLILRCCDKDGKSYNGFQWPLQVGATVEAPDWKPTQECGNGLHGWPWGLSMGDGKEPDWGGKWIVFGADPDTVIDLGGKVKAPSGTIRFVGGWAKASAFVLSGQMAWVHENADGAASATGWSGAASATGWSGAASATGWSGAASATGERGAASATGWSGAAVVTGLDGTAEAGPYGCIALAWWNPRRKQAEMRCAEIGNGKDKKLKPGVRYKLNSRGQFVRADAEEVD